MSTSLNYVLKSLLTTVIITSHCITINIELLQGMLFLTLKK